MTSSPIISIIITTYKRPDALKQVLSHLSRQSDSKFDIVVADDGSDVTTLNVIKQFSDTLLIDHVWQENKGFRASMIRNKAVAKARGNYIIFLDGDCIPLTHFVKNHRYLAEKGWFVSGNRILLSNIYTREIEKKEIFFDQWSIFRWIAARFARKCNRILPIFSLPFGVFKKLKFKSWAGAKTCNLAIWKSDFFEVNGFDEAYQGWGYEDSDLVIRLIRKGVFRKNARYLVPVLHMWHPPNDQENRDENLKRLRDIQHSKNILASVGIDQYLSNR